MASKRHALNADVSQFLAQLQHPFALEIDVLRNIILAAHPQLEENIKWNGPNYHINGEDRVTMRIHPPKKLQLIFHRGAKVLAQPKSKLIDDDTNLLDWKANDRAVATFINMEQVKATSAVLERIVKDWVKAAG